MAKKKTETTNNLELEQKIIESSAEITTENSTLENPKTVVFETTTDFDVEKQRKKQLAANITKNVFVYLFLTICAVLAFLPFYWMIISSVKHEREYRASTPTFFPQAFMWKNYAVVLSQSDSGGSSFLQILINTLVVGFFSTTIGVIVTIVTAYALARMDFKGKNLLFSLMLGTMMIPGEMYTLTNYLTVLPSLQFALYEIL